MPRFHCPDSLVSDTLMDLPAGAARHVQVLRMQPGESITLFNGQGGEFEATITLMGRSQVQVRLGQHTRMEREATPAVHLAIGIPANERMDWLIEKATELGVASIQPLLAERSVLRLSGPRADKKLVHWRGIAIAACEQCGRNRIPQIHDLVPLSQWLHAPLSGSKLLLSLQGASQLLQQARPQDAATSITFLSGPEGGLTAAEEALALDQGFSPVSLGRRVLRAETAPLAALAALTLLA